MGKQWKQCLTLFSWAPKSLQMVTAAMKLKDACYLEGKLWPTDTILKKQRHYFANKDLSSQSYGFSSGRVWMWELDCEEGWVPKYWCFWTVVLEKTLESPLDVRECLTGGFLCAVSHKFSVPYQFLFWEQVKLHAALGTEIMKNGMCLDSFHSYF